MFQMLKKKEHRKLRIKLFFRGRVLQNARIARGRGRQNNAHTRVVNVTRVMRFSNQKHCNIFVV